MFSKTSLLYVDDEPSLLELGKIFLERDAFQVDTCDSAVEALEILKERTFDVIVSDYQMPVIDGIQFLKILRSSNNSTPFIIFTGKGREDVVIEALNNGADFYLQKGGNPTAQFAELSNQIRFAIQRFELESVVHIQKAMEASVDPMILANGNGKFILVNKSATRLYGYQSAEEMMNLHWFRLIHAVGRDTIRIAALSDLNSKGFHQAQGEGIRKDGTIFQMDYTLTKLDDGSLIFVARDITERVLIEEALKRHIELHAALVDIVHRFIQLPLGEKDEAINQSLAMMSKMVNADRAYIFEYDFNMGVTSNTYEWCAPGIEPQIDELQNIDLKSLPEFVENHMKNETVFIFDVSSLPDGYVKGHLEQQNIKSLLTIPFFHKGICKGFVGYDSVVQNRKYSKEELDVLTVFANMMITLEEGLQMERLVTSKSEEMQMILDTMPIQVWYLTDELTYGAVNKAHADFYGLEVNDMSNHPMEDFLSPEVIETRTAGILKVFRERKPIQIEEWLTNFNGEERLLKINKTPRFQEDGKVQYVVCSAIDITDSVD